MPSRKLVERDTGTSADTVTTDSGGMEQEKRNGPVLEATRDVLHVLHAASTGGVSALRLLSPLVCIRFSPLIRQQGQSHTRCKARANTYTTGAWPPGSRTKRTTCAACGTSDDRSDGRACGSWCGGDRTRWYPSSTGAHARAGVRQKESQH